MGGDGSKKAAELDQQGPASPRSSGRFKQRLISAGLIAIGLVFAGALLGLGYEIDTRHIQPRDRFAWPKDTVTCYVHRVNDAEALERALPPETVSSSLSLGKRVLRWGIETDLQFRDGQLLVYHDVMDRSSLKFKEFVAQLPAEIVVALDLKESMNSSKALDALEAAIEGSPRGRFVVVSFDIGLIRKLERRSELGIFLMSWQVNPRSNIPYRVFEYLYRVSGHWGGLLEEQVAVDGLAYPWQSADALTVQSLESRGLRTIAGGVDSKAALEHCLDSGAPAFFTDRPRLILESAGGR